MIVGIIFFQIIASEEQGWNLNLWTNVNDQHKTQKKVIE